MHISCRSYSLAKLQSKIMSILNWKWDQWRQHFLELIFMFLKLWSKDGNGEGFWASFPPLFVIMPRCVCIYLCIYLVTFSNGTTSQVLCEWQNTVIHREPAHMSQSFILPPIHTAPYVSLCAIFLARVDRCQATDLYIRVGWLILTELSLNLGCSRA